MRSAHCSAERHVHVDQLQLSPLPGAAVDGFDPEWLPAGSGGPVEICRDRLMRLLFSNAFG
jgi:hypothetical protein